MIVNMACPKCGGQASEYDAGKWSCLQCQNKFLYQPPPPPAPTVINNSINIQGGMFDLDASNVRRPMPVFKKLKETNPSVLAEFKRIERELDEQRKVTRLHPTPAIDSGIGVAVLMFLVCILVTNSSITLKDEIFYVCLILGLMFAFLPILAVLQKQPEARRTIKELLTRQQALAREGDEDVLAGHIITCPDCEAVLDFILMGKPMPTGLQHCLKCGKQFFTSQGYSYPLVRHQGVNALPIAPVAFALSPQPTLTAKSVACPLCAGMIPLPSIRVGLNKCPHCAGEFEAE